MSETEPLPDHLRRHWDVEELTHRWSAQDATDADRVREVVDDAWRRLGRVEAVVSNAGYGLFGAVEEMTDAQVERQLDTNVLGTISLLRAVLPHMRAQGGGRSCSWLARRPCGLFPG